MAYIGKQVEETELTDRTVDTMTGDGSDTTLALSSTPISINNVLVSLNGIMQRPTTDYTLSGSTITFSTAPVVGVIVVAITGGGEHIGRPLAELGTEKFMNAAVTDAKIVTMASSKLTGAMPAIDGTLLTGSGAGIGEYTTNPLPTSNPATGVGTMWVNKVTGELFSCTDATTNENIWINVGTGYGDVKTWHGKQHGYAAGGTPATNGIQRFAFSSGTQNAEDLGDMTGTRTNGGSWSSLSHGFSVGGYKAGPATDSMEKFSFSSAVDSMDIGNLTETRTFPIGYHDAGKSVGYVTGGGFVGGNTATQEKYSFDRGGNTSLTNSLTVARSACAATQTATSGYTIGGHITNVNPSNLIEKTSFASDAVSTYSGTLSNASGTSIVVRHPNAVASLTHFYVCGGFANAVGHSDDIWKFSFTSESSGTDIANLTTAERTNAGCSSSTTAGYVMAGTGASASASIDRINFASDTTIVDSGDLVAATGQADGVRGFQV